MIPNWGTLLRWPNMILKTCLCASDKSRCTTLQKATGLLVSQVITLLASYCCRNKLTQTLHHLTVLRVRSPKIRWWLSWFLPKALGRIWSLPFPASRDLAHILSRDALLTLQSPSAQPLLLLSFLRIDPSAFLINRALWLHVANLDNPAYLPISRSLF